MLRIQLPLAIPVVNDISGLTSPQSNRVQLERFVPPLSNGDSIGEGLLDLAAAEKFGWGEVFRHMSLAASSVESKVGLRNIFIPSLVLLISRDSSLLGMTTRL